MILICIHKSIQVELQFRSALGACRRAEARAVIIRNKIIKIHGLGAKNYVRFIEKRSDAELRANVKFELPKQVSDRDASHFDPKPAIWIAYVFPHIACVKIRLCWAFSRDDPNERAMVQRLIEESRDAAAPTIH